MSVVFIVGGRTEPWTERQFNLIHCSSEDSFTITCTNTVLWTFVSTLIHLLTYFNTLIVHLLP